MRLPDGSPERAPQIAPAAGLSYLGRAQGRRYCLREICAFRPFILAGRDRVGARNSCRVDLISAILTLRPPAEVWPVYLRRPERACALYFKSCFISSVDSLLLPCIARPKCTSPLVPLMDTGSSMPA